MTERIAIVGVAESDFGTVPDKTIHQLHAQAATRALHDAGLQRGDIDGFFSCGGTDGMHPLQMSEYLGLKPKYVDSTSVGGSSWELYVEHAIAAIRDRRCTTALLVYGSTAKSDVARRLRSADAAAAPRGPNQFEAPFGPTLISKYAMIARRHMAQYGTTSEQLAAIAVATRRNAMRNPLAVMRQPLTIDDVLNAKMVADPLHLPDCCLRTDGGGAVILTTAERARSLAKKPIWVLGAATAVSHLTMAQMADMTVSPSSICGPAAMAEAGITHSDIDVLQIYDSFTITVLLTLEALGVCPRGEAGAFVEGGTLRPGGACPINTSGGGLSYCHPGMFGIFLIIEAVRQLQGSAGARQLDRAHTALCHGTGGIFSTHATVVLEAL